MKCTNFKHILALLTYDLKSPVFEQEALKKSKMEPGHPVKIKLTDQKIKDVCVM